MPGIVRKGDKCSGHGCFPPRESNQASPNVYVNGQQAVREGDEWSPHTCGSTHTGNVTTGSSSVYINGIPVARQGDVISPDFCGSTAQEASSNVSAG